ncbi:MAG: hypothetical protein HY821_14620, partial [Acidobacteria bacterium]|nr:hypothetical protein [Acidobacteriota bacterium]
MILTRMFTVAALAAALAAPVPAQRGRQAAEQFEKISTALNLSADQKQKIQPILQEEAGKLRALRSDQSLSQQDRRD